MVETVADRVADPVLGTGEVIIIIIIIVVDVVATRLQSYAHEVLSGARGYLLELPAIPGSRRHRPCARIRAGRDASCGR